MARALVFLIVVFIADVTVAATIRVEKDGTGDFIIIQNAVDVAASGDTIMIGPGRFNDGAVVSTPGWTEFVRVLVRQSELTLIGSGDETTVIGPETTYDYTQGDHMGIESGPYWGNQMIRVSDIGFENMAYAVRGAPGPNAVIDNCRFYNNALSVWYALGGHVDISNSTFDSTPNGGGSLVDINSIDSFNINNCNFHLSLDTINSEICLHLQSIPNASVTECLFSEGNVGLYLSGVPSVVVDHCVFDGQSSDNGRNSAAIIVSGGSLVLTNSLLERQRRGLLLDSWAHVEMSHSQIVNVSESSIRTNIIGSLTVNNCVLAHGPQYTIWQYFPCNLKGELPHFDLTNNDWGTSQADSITSWISTCEYIVDYVPYVGMPVATEEKSWGSVKSMFR